MAEERRHHAVPLPGCGGEDGGEAGNGRRREGGDPRPLLGGSGAVTGGFPLSCGTNGVQAVTSPEMPIEAERSLPVLQEEGTRGLTITNTTRRHRSCDRAG